MGLYQSMVIAFFGIAAFWNENPSSTGRNYDLFCMGTSMFTAVVITVNLKIVLITKYAFPSQPQTKTKTKPNISNSRWTFWNHLVLYFSVVIWFVWILVYEFVTPNEIITVNTLYWYVYEYMTSAVFWFNPLLAVSVCMLPELFYK
jgi:hypothetical protein